jgi:hypothetical protein
MPRNLRIITILICAVLFADSALLADPPLPIDPPIYLSGKMVRVYYWNSEFGQPKCVSDQLPTGLPSVKGKIISLNDQGYVHMWGVIGNSPPADAMIPTGNVVLIQRLTP